MDDGRTRTLPRNSIDNCAVTHLSIWDWMGFIDSRPALREIPYLRPHTYIYNFNCIIRLFIISLGSLLYYRVAQNVHVYDSLTVISFHQKLYVNISVSDSDSIWCHQYMMMKNVLIRNIYGFLWNNIYQHMKSLWITRLQ